MNASSSAGVNADRDYEIFFLFGCTSFKNHIAHEVHFMCTKGREEIINGRSAICVAIPACGLPVECIVAVLCCVCVHPYALFLPLISSSPAKRGKERQVRAQEKEKLQGNKTPLLYSIVGRIFVCFVC